MISIILAASDECRRKAKEAGFEEMTVLIRWEGVMSTAENKRRLESELFELKPYQFLVDDYWGMGVD